MNHIEDNVSSTADEDEVFKLDPIDEGVNRIRNIVYGVIGKRKLILDMYTPEVIPNKLNLVLFLFMGVVGNLGLNTNLEDSPLILQKNIR